MHSLATPGLHFLSSAFHIQCAIAERFMHTRWMRSATRTKVCEQTGRQTDGQLALSQKTLI